MVKSIPILIVSLILLGCSTNQLKPNVAVPDGHGTIAVALTSNELIGSYVAFRVAKDGEPQFDCMRNTGCFIDDTKDFLEIDGSIGNVVAYTYPPGKYYFDSWHIAQALYMRDSTWVPENLTPIYFEVKENEVTYLGRFHTHILIGKNLSGYEILAGGIIESLDDADITIPILYKKFPNLSEMKLNKEVLDVEVWNQDVVKYIENQ